MKFAKTTATALSIMMLFSGCSLFGNNEKISGDGGNNESTTQAETEEENIYFSTEHGNSNGNITNLGASVCVGKYIYAQNGEDGYKLYRTDKKGNNPVKLNDCATYFINVVGDYIYYCNGDDEFRIYRMKLDGSDNQQVYDHSAYYLNVENGYMYFSDYDDNRTLYRMTLDGSKNWQLSEIAADYVNVVGDDAYYCNFDEKTYGIYRVNFITKKAEKVCSYICGYLNVTNQYLYFTDIQVGLNREGTNKLYRINRDDYSDSKELISSQCGTFTIEDDKIYYINYDDEDKIYRADLDGQNQVKFVDESAKYVCTAGKRIYYIHVIDNDNFELKNLSFKECLG